MKLHLLALPVLALALVPAARADVHVVDAGGGGDFTDLQPAVDAAQDGDTLLVKPGNYSRAEIVGKALQVMGDSGGIARVVGGMAVRSTAVDQDVVLNRLWIEGQTFGVLDGLQVDLALGAVRVERCEIFGASSLTEAHGGDGVDVTGSQDVALVATLLLGGNGWDQSPFGSDGGDGLRAESSRVGLHACQAQGGNGGNSDPVNDFPGMAGHGVHAIDSFAYVAGTSCFGGDGGGDDLFACFPGGDGVRLEGAQTQGYLLDVAAQGGRGACGAASGSPVATIGGASLTTFPGQSRGVQPPRVVREGEPLVLLFHGEPGDVVIVGLSGEAQFLPLVVPCFGVLYLENPPLGPRQIAGTLDASGTLQVVLPAPTLPAGVEDQLARIQPIVHTFAGETRLGSPATVVVIDDAF